MQVMLMSSICQSLFVVPLPHKNKQLQNHDICETGEMSAASDIYKNLWWGFGMAVLTEYLKLTDQLDNLFPI